MGKKSVKLYTDNVIESFYDAVINNNLEKIKPLIATLKQKVAEGVEPFIVAVDKWKAGEKLSEEEKNV